MTYSEALALVMLGRQEEAFEAVAELDADSGRLSPWLLECGTIWKADLLHCAGRRDEPEQLQFGRSTISTYDFSHRRLQDRSLDGQLA